MQVTKESSPRTAGNRALIVDDDADVRRAMRRLLSALGFEVTLAANGSEALNRDLESFDVLFIDLNMPIMNGRELKRELDRRNVRVPVVVVSGECDVAAAALSMGAVAWIAKPCTASAIRRALGDLTVAAKVTETGETQAHGSVCATGNA